MTIRAMEMRDLPEILAVVSDGWGRDTAQAAQPDFCEMFSASAWKPHFYVCVDDLGRVIGAAGWKVSWLCYGVYDLFWVMVRKDRRGEGVGKALVQRCLDDTGAFADVVMLATNVPDFYRKNWGFEIISGLPTSNNLAQVLMMRGRHP